MSEIKPAESSTPEPAFPEALLAHAIRCWDAERENADRLSKRANLVLAGIAALLGLGFFQLEWFHPSGAVPVIQSPAAIWVVKGFLISGLIAFAVAFVLIVRPTGNRTPELVKGAPSNDSPAAAQAADRLALPEWMMEGPLPSESNARKLAFTQVYAAYLDLRRRNAAKREVVGQGQAWFIFGLCLVVVAIVVYTLWRVP